MSKKGRENERERKRVGREKKTKPPTSEEASDKDSKNECKLEACVT